MILDTTFLIDLERELRRQEDGAACAALRTREMQTPLCVTETVLGELAAGDSLADRNTWERFIAPYHVLPMDRETAWHYGCVFRALRRSGRLIGANDLWIAAAGLAHQLPILTRNGKEFRQVPGLRVLEYSH